MRKINFIVILLAIFSTQTVFANKTELLEDSSNPACVTIAKACVKAGYAKTETHKKFWFDCMKPIILGKTVTDVTIDSSVAKTCRDAKIEEYKNDLKELENASS